MEVAEYAVVNGNASSNLLLFIDQNIISARQIVLIGDGVKGLIDGI